jgi:ABC-type proline/glycine betaine transport system permease subunit
VTTLTLTRRVGRGLGLLARNWLLFFALLGIWELSTRLAKSPFFPPPTEILTTSAKLWFTGPASQLFLTDTVFANVLPSLGRTLGGWALAGALGVALGVVLGRSKHGMDYVGPLFAFFRSVPPPALIPVFIVLFGLGPGMQTGSIIFGAIFVLGAAFQFVSIDSAEVANSFTYGGQQLTQYPLSIFGKDIVRAVTFVVPLAFVNYYPVLYVLGKPAPLGLPSWIGLLAPAVAAAMVALAALAWRGGLRRYRSTGS